MLQVQVEEEQEKTLNFFFLWERGDEEGREKANFLLLSGQRERERERDGCRAESAEMGTWSLNNLEIIVT